MASMIQRLVPDAKVAIAHGRMTSKDLENIILGFLNKEFNVSDIRNITKEVFGNKPMIIQQVELYKDMVQISVKEASEEQVSSLNDKINEKYGLENAISDVKVVDIPNVRLRNVIKPYILPVSIVSVLTIIFAMIVYRKLGVWKVLYDTAMAIVAPQAILSSLYAVTRIPINRIATIVAISVFALSITMIILKLNITKQKLFKEKEDSKKVEKG